LNRGNRIAVVGAGLGGLTCAAFLQREGFAVTVYEQAPAFSRIGAGIILSANVMKVLRRLGIERRLLEAGISPDAFVSRAWDTGEALYEITLDAASEVRFGGPYINVHRGDLHAVLETAVRPGSIAFGHSLVGLEQTGEAIQLVFENGARQEADIVIGADGIRSKVRDILLKQIDEKQRAQPGRKVEDRTPEERDPSRILDAPAWNAFCQTFLRGA